MYDIYTEQIDLDGCVIVEYGNKQFLVQYAAPQELISIEPAKRLTKINRIIQVSPSRVTPLCSKFGICGGCTLQHIDVSMQIKLKEEYLVHELSKHCTTFKVLPYISVNSYHYRTRARLSVRHVAKKSGILIGFHERNSSFVTNSNECVILPDMVSQLIPHLKSLIGSLSIYNKIPQIELAHSESLCVLVLRILSTLSEADNELIKNFINTHNLHPIKLQIWLQPYGPDSAYPFYPIYDSLHLQYTIRIDNRILNMPYHPTDFTQINTEVNQLMINQVLHLLCCNKHKKVLDFFCGLGNFTLPLTYYANHVVGIEGSDRMVKRAKDNAKLNGLSDRVEYHTKDLFKITAQDLLELGRFDQWIIDPPRTGALTLIKAITPEIAPTAIIYVSCNISSLARDAGILVNLHNYSIHSTCAVNMFPHTKHLESITLFVKNV